MLDHHPAGGEKKHKSHDSGKIPSTTKKGGGLNRWKKTDGRWRWMNVYSLIFSLNEYLYSIIYKIYMYMYIYKMFVYRNILHPWEYYQIAYRSLCPNVCFWTHIWCHLFSKPVEDCTKKNSSGSLNKLESYGFCVQWTNTMATQKRPWKMILPETNSSFPPWKKAKPCQAPKGD